MTRDDLNKYYNEHVSVIAKEIVKNNDDLEFNANCSAFYEEYLALKALMKKIDGPGEGEKLDRHKRSACMTVALLKLRQITDTTLNETKNETARPDFLANSTRANAQLAILTGLDNLIAYMELDDPGILNEGFIFPESTLEKDGDGGTYLDSLVRALYYTGLVSLGNINLLLLSNIYFLLEEYHKKSNQPKQL